MNEGSSLMIGFPQPPAISAILRDTQSAIPISIVWISSNSPVYTSHKDANIGAQERIAEQSEAPVVPDCIGNGTGVTSSDSSSRSVEVFQTQRPEQTEHNALKRDSRDDQPIAVSEH